METRDPRETAAVIRRMKADVVVLQEVPAEKSAALSRTLAPQFRYRYLAGSSGIVSRFPLHRLRFEPSVRGLNGFLFARVELGGRQVQVVDLHLDPLRTWTRMGWWTLPFQLLRQPSIQRAELEQVFARLQPGLPVILLGDFNRATDGAVRLLRRRGYADSFAAVSAHPDRVPTLHYSVLGHAGAKRVDFIFHDASFRTLRSAVIPGSPSDHDAIWSELGGEVTRESRRPHHPVRAGR